jgi:hypothetical protein
MAPVSNRLRRLWSAGLTRQSGHGALWCGSAASRSDAPLGHGLGPSGRCAGTRGWRGRRPSHAKGPRPPGLTQWPPGADRLGAGLQGRCSSSTSDPGAAFATPQWRPAPASESWATASKRFQTRIPSMATARTGTITLKHVLDNPCRRQELMAGGSVLYSWRNAQRWSCLPRCKATPRLPTTASHADQNKSLISVHQCHLHRTNPRTQSSTFRA